jgi:hypothetical protein
LGLEQLLGTLAVWAPRLGKDRDLVVGDRGLHLPVNSALGSAIRLAYLYGILDGHDTLLMCRRVGGRSD